MTVYVVIPSLMIFLTLVLRPRMNRIANVGLGVVHALTIIVGAIGEWSYYILGSAIQVALLAIIVYYARTWPKKTPLSSTIGAGPRPTTSKRWRSEERSFALSQDVRLPRSGRR